VALVAVALQAALNVSDVGISGGWGKDDDHACPPVG
jgi:hypothetical protein